MNASVRTTGSTLSSRRGAPPSGNSAELMLRFRRADGTWALCEGHRTNLLREPAVKSMVLNLHDITERARASDEIVKARDAAVAAMNVKSQFLAAMSHEVRTPLNGVLGLTELILDTELNEEQTQYATNAYSAAENLLRIVNDILDFSKVEAGRLVIEDAPLDPGAVLREVTALLAPQARAKGLLVEARVKSGAAQGSAGRRAAPAPGPSERRCQCGQVHRRRLRRTECRADRGEPRLGFGALRRDRHRNRNRPRRPGTDLRCICSSR